MSVLPMSPLLERDGDLAALQATVTDAASRRGSVVLLAGEAGIGKSSLVEAWRQDPGGDARVLVGWCDDFLTSRTLGPLLDVALSMRNGIQLVGYAALGEPDNLVGAHDRRDTDPLSGRRVDDHQPVLVRDRPRGSDTTGHGWWPPQSRSSPSRSPRVRARPQGHRRRCGRRW
jgi:hypothetical protein